MDSKKQQNFSKQANSKACQSSESSRKFSDVQLNKPWLRASRHRETLNVFKSDQQRSNKQQAAQVVRSNVDKRPRPRGSDNGYQSNRASLCRDNFVDATGPGLASEDSTISIGNARSLGSGDHGAVAKNMKYADHEVNSVNVPGSKKQNLNHLLNFHYASKEFDYPYNGVSVFGRGGTTMGRIGSGKVKKQKYNKEQFMQANFQFAVKPSAKPKLFTSPDTLVDWDLIEQINVQTTEEPRCPICLYPPIAAKMTRCGHAYCWPCILHYLALTDKTWRKCPICYEAIHTADLKSTMILQQQPVMTGGQITFQLMRRKKGSMFIERHTSEARLNLEYFPGLGSTDGEAKLFSKFLIAYSTDIVDIIERERRELLADEDQNCPEFIFVQQALDFLNARREGLEITDVEYEEFEVKKTSVKILENIEESLSNEVGMNATASNRGDADLTENNKDKEQREGKQFPNREKLENIKYYYFYQSVDGQNIFLHPLNVKMIQACYGSLNQAPMLVNGCILQKDYHSMDEEHRRKFTCLAHLPLTCQFSVVEIDLKPPHITDDIMKLFADDILNRKKDRQWRDREERKRERRIDELNNRQLGKLISSTAKLNLGSSSEFPSCGLDYVPLNGNELEAARSDVISTSNHNATYSLVAVTGAESHNFDLWPNLASATNNCSSDRIPSSAWGKSKAVPIPLSSDARGKNYSESNEMFSDSDIGKSLSPLGTNLGDVLAEALCHKKQGPTERLDRGNEHINVNAASNKKNKKSKKMQPLFSTGMNYNGK